MKKAYVKPVFLAEEFVAASSYATSCGVSQNKPFDLYLGMDFCKNEGNTSDGDKGHYVGGSPDATLDNAKGTIMSAWHYDGKYSNWTYALKEDNKATIFLDVKCDFCWDPSTGNSGPVYVWNDVTTENRTEKYTGGDIAWGFSKFFAGANPDDKKHSVAFEGTKAPQLS